MPQTILITGANRGIGLALTQRYLGQGERVIATCRNPNKAEALKALEKDNGNLSILPLEVTDETSIAALACTLNGNTIDVLINNAGILSGVDPYHSSSDQDPSQALDSFDPDGFEKILKINTIAPIMVIKALLPNLRSSKTRKVAMISSGWGSITNLPDDSYMAYGSSKAALNFITKSIALTLQSEQFVVVSLNPGWVRTDMGSQDADLAPEESARRLVKIIDALTPRQTGQFLRHTGELIAW